MQRCLAMTGTVWVALLVAWFSFADDGGRIAYPSTRRVDHVDIYHGVKVADPYRWLEDDVRKSPEVAAWVEAQNRVTFAYLKGIPEREGIHRRLTELVNYERYSSPQKVA